MSILVTGATGFIGRRVLAKLLKIYDPKEIIVLSASGIDGIKSIDSMNYTFESGYLIANGCKTVDTLIHIGAFIPKVSSELNDIEKNTSNITYTKLLLDSIDVIHNLKKIIFISTVDVYAKTNDKMNEQSALMPESLYGWSKLYCEEIIKAFALKKDIQYTILRVGHVYGEGEEKYRKVMPIMIKSALDGGDINIYGDGEATRSYIYVDDVAQSIVNALNMKESSTINVVGEEAISINTLANMIVEIIGKDSINIIHTASSSINRNLNFDNTMMKQNLLESSTPFSQGLRREIEYMKSL